MSTMRRRGCNPAESHLQELNAPPPRARNIQGLYPATVHCHWILTWAGIDLFKTGPVQIGIQRAALSRTGTEPGMQPRRGNKTWIPQADRSGDSAQTGAACAAESKALPLEDRMPGAE